MLDSLKRQPYKPYHMVLPINLVPFLNVPALFSPPNEEPNEEEEKIFIPNKTIHDQTKCLEIVQEAQLTNVICLPPKKKTYSYTEKFMAPLSLEFSLGFSKTREKNTIDLELPGRYRHEELAPPEYQTTERNAPFKSPVEDLPSGGPNLSLRTVFYSVIGGGLRLSPGNETAESLYDKSLWGKYAVGNYVFIYDVTTEVSLLSVEIFARTPPLPLSDLFALQAFYAFDFGQHFSTHITTGYHAFNIPFYEEKDPSHGRLPFSNVDDNKKIANGDIQEHSAGLILRISEGPEFYFSLAVFGFTKVYSCDPVEKGISCNITNSPGIGVELMNVGWGLID